MVVNAALTGVYDYAGSLEMIRRAVRSRGAATVIVVQTPDMMASPISHEGVVFAADSLESVLAMPVANILAIPMAMSG